MAYLLHKSSTFR